MYKQNQRSIQEQQMYPGSGKAPPLIHLPTGDPSQAPHFIGKGHLGFRSGFFVVGVFFLDFFTLHSSDCPLPFLEV